MKTRILICVVSVVCRATLSLADTEASTILSYNPVAFYQFNETGNPNPGPVTAVDSMGTNNGRYMTNAANGYNGISGPQAPAYPGFSGANTALQTTYNLANSFVGLPGLNIKTNTATILAWINPRGRNGENSAGIVESSRDAGNGSGTNTCGLEYAQGNAVNGQYPLGCNWRNSGWNWSTSGLYPPTNQWSLAAMVVTPTNITLYLMNTNGIQSAVTNINNAAANWTTGGTNYIGTDPYSMPGRNFDGSIDDVALFNYCLSQAQLQNIFFAGYPCPIIATQPVSQEVYPGLSATFTVAAIGNAPLYYNWQKAGKNLVDQGNVSGSATATLTIANASPADTNNYDVVVTNSYGALTSSVVALTLIATNVPQISSEPVSLEVNVGQTAQFTVSATASGTLSYQWEAGAIGSGVFTNLTDGGDISGSATSTLTISDPGEGNAADYVVVITSSDGQVISRVATLTVGTWEEAGQGGAVTAVAASPDGVWMAAGSDDATVKMWRASDGGLERTLAASGLLEVTALAFGPGGTNLAAGYYDGTLRLWNTANGALIRTYTNCYGKVACLAFSPNGQQIAIGGGDWLTRILRLSDGTVLNNGGSGSVINYGVVRSVAYSPDGSKLAVAGEDTNLIKQIVVLNSSNWATLASLAQGYNNTNLASSNSVTSLVFSPNGATLASSCLDQTICMWSTANWALQRTLTNAGPGVTALAFVPGGQTLFSGDQGGNITAWAAAGAIWSATHSWSGHTNAVWSLACSADDSRLVSGGDDHQVKLWQTANGAAVTNLTSHTAMITRACFAPDGSMVATAGNDGSLRLWAAQTGAPAYILTGHTNQVSALAFSPDATFLVSGGGCLDNDISVWSCANGTLLQTSPLLTIPSLFTNGVTALAVSPDTSLIASAGDRYEQVIKLWNRANGGLVCAFAGHSSGTAVLAFSPNGQYLASGGMFASGSIKLWDLSNGSCAFTYAGHTCTVMSLSFNPTGALLASAGQNDGLINIWSNGMVTPVLSLTSLSAGARAVAFSPDGTLLAAAGSDTIQMWQTSNWQLVWSCASETVGINTLSFSPNGTFLLFGREDGTVGRMWNPLAAPVRMYLGATQAGQFTISNPSYSPFLTVQTSSDLAHWNVLTNLVAATNWVRVADPSPPSAARFYRVSTPQ
jgi:WD40 repeat protein